jgi:23S rRNA (uracil1939-C5)-methyltransferase
MSDAPANNSFEVILEKLVYGGEALGRLPDGRALFVPYGLPGEHVRVRLVEEKRGFARAQLVDVLVPSQERITPICQHFTICGGCHYQHMPYEMQLRAKADILRDQLVRIGGLENPRINDTIPSSKQLNYRNHVQFHLDSDGKLGYQKWRSREVVPITECHLPEETLNDLWPQLEIEPQPELERVSLRLGAQDAALLILESNSDEVTEIKMDIPVAAVHMGPQTVQVLADTNMMMMDILGRSFQVSAGSFFQVNSGMAERLVTHLQENLSLSADTTLMDVYCGVGLFSAFLAPKVGNLIGVEDSPSACDDFIVNLDEFNNVSLYQDNAERVLPAVDERVDIIVVDPPRNGLTRPVMDAILEKHKPVVLAYVSCDAATLGRDAKRLAAGGYRLAQATPFDLFPQTFHIESISFWERD